MLGNLGYYSGKGMVLVPDLSGLSSSAAQSAITSAGLTVGSISSTSSGANSSNNGQVASSSPTAGTLVDYETSVSFVTYSYSPPPEGPSWTDSSIVNSFTQGTAYSDSVSATNGAAYTWEYVDSGNGASPSSYWVQGITIDNSSGAISGTPTMSGQTYSFRIVAYNGGGTIYSPTYSGTVGSSGGGSGSSISVSITSVTAYSMSGTVSYSNVTGAYGSISISSSGGSINPTSMVYSGEAYPGITTGSTSFTVLGLSPSTSYTVTASGSLTSTPGSATATTSPAAPEPQYNYYFEYDLGTPMVPSNGELTASGSTYVSQAGNVTINAGTGCGSQTFYAFASGTWYWICYRVPV